MAPVRSIVAGLHPLLRQRVSLGRDESRKDIYAVGEMGERIACQWLRATGRKVLFRNFRAPRGGEVDIVARDGDRLCFIEVKTRTKHGDGRPSDAVDAKKQSLIERGGREWLRLLNRRDVPCRYDIIEVFLIEGEKPEVKLLKNVFREFP